MKKIEVKYVVIAIIMVIIIAIGIWLISRNDDTKKKIDYNKTFSLKEIDNHVVRDIYYQFNLENDMLFNILGSGNNKDYYGLFYKNNKIGLEDLDDYVKYYIVLNSLDIRNNSMDQDRDCYKVTLEDMKVRYGKLFGNEGDFKFEYRDDIGYRMDVNDQEICVYDEVRNDYKYLIDTYFLSYDMDDDSIIMREKVAFIKIVNEKYNFYSDYKMENLVYSLNSNKGGIDFVNNKDVVSSVLMEEQDFPVYKYTFVKNGEYYHFKSIELE